MALNWAMLNPNRTPVPLAHEVMLRTVPSGADLTVIIPDAPPTGSSTFGGSGGSRKLKESGGLWLTDQRLIFVASEDKGSEAVLDSLTLPLQNLLASRFEQPYFGANHLVLDVKPNADGGLTTGTKVEVRFSDKGIFEFASLLDKTRERAIYMKRHQVEEEEGLPTYASPSAEQGSITPVPLSFRGEKPPNYEDATS
ncbi:hypothetical protein NLI96_g5116 [Meripilus lineatus]|uniref:YokE-like PH domain-containing protein n=1 Tax=Meripilus lineatus TaxID=2056292 RepID=A0AAD5YE66_9APHY|nr:hypothetical protein NLI96_g5116 [Physisporinus lineatus]